MIDKYPKCYNKYIIQNKNEYYDELEWAASNGNRYPPYPQVMATAISQ